MERRENSGVNTHGELASNTVSLLVEKFVRKRYSAISIIPLTSTDHHICTLFNWHYEQIIETEQLLINDFNIPPTRAIDLLPRINPQFMGHRIRWEIRLQVGDVHDRVSEDHRHKF